MSRIFPRRSPRTWRSRAGSGSSSPLAGVWTMTGSGRPAAAPTARWIWPPVPTPPGSACSGTQGGSAVREHEAGISLVEVLVALLLVGIALVPLMQLYPGTLGFNLDAEYDFRLSAAATRKSEELIGLLRVPTGGDIAFDA